MRAIVVMFDSLNRHYLPPYRPDCGIQAPNFERLARQSVLFENSYAGSMPCMPARRELHTGRYNFLHRGWGPMEPFDDSVPVMLGKAGVATHLATDHMHYWEDGGATYHTRYGTCSLIRGQQGDPWKGRVADPKVPESLRIRRGGTWRQDRINREYIDCIPEHPQTLTFDAGLEFVRDNAGEQDWFVQIETFDPHEPFFSDPSYLALYGGDDTAVPEYDWPDYVQVTESEAVQRNVRRHYAALVTMCDESLGRVLDAMDEHRLWEDTMLVVCTDHGFLLGEQGWWGKSTPPWYDETIHTPLFVWDPRAGVQGARRDALVQTIDIGPTLLDLFGVPATADMQGRSLREAVEEDRSPRTHALFGAFGGHVSITDGRYVYMRACQDETNQPLHEHTLMPTHMRGFFSAQELSRATLHEGFSFTKGMPVLRTPGHTFTNPHTFGTLLFDLAEDPGQQHPLVDDELELAMARALVEALRASEAPPSQYERLGLPVDGDVTERHLLCRAQRSEVERSRRAVPAESDFPDARLSVRTPVADLLAHPGAAEVLARHCGPVLVGSFGAVCGDISLYRAASLMLGVLPWDRLRVVADELAAVSGPPA
jgi:arylsulfatase A-like enzyme